MYKRHKSKKRILEEHLSYCKSAVAGLKRKHIRANKNPGYFLDQIKKTEKLLSKL